MVRPRALASSLGALLSATCLTRPSSVPEKLNIWSFSQILTINSRMKKTKPYVASPAGPGPPWGRQRATLLPCARHPSRVPAPSPPGDSPVPFPRHPSPGALVPHLLTVHFLLCPQIGLTLNEPFRSSKSSSFSLSGLPWGLVPSRPPPVLSPAQTVTKAVSSASSSGLASSD